jgi:hypothetical protein
VARLYARFLASVGVLPGSTIRETTGSKLANGGISGCQKLIDEVLGQGGGALFIDEAYQLSSGSTYGGTGVLDFLLAEVENLTGKICFILAGYNKQMESLFAHNPGLPSRFPISFQFKDYEDHELLRILSFQIQRKYKDLMKVEDGPGGLFCRVAARRIGYARGKEGFGNARAVENALAKIQSRQAQRLRYERRAGKQPDDMLLTKEDILGPKPEAALKENASWRKLKAMIGLQKVKSSIEALVDSIQANYLRELAEEPRVQFNLNRVFLGSPGTGKTSVAKLYGQILADIGLLSNGEVVIKNPADFIGNVMGASESTTKGILSSTVGKVLVVDEAYGLCGGTTGSAGPADPYRAAVIDTIVAEVQSTPGEDRCVLLLGYKNQMEDMFQIVNPGLSRRFPLSEAFTFEDFTDNELAQVLDLKMKQEGFRATAQAKQVAIDVLSRARNRPNFGNAGEVDILLNGAKARLQARMTSTKGKKTKNTHASVFEAEDIDPDFDRGKHAATNIAMLFKDVIGCEEIVAKLQGYQKTVANMRARNLNPREQIPFNFIFIGPPGT